MLSRRRSNVTRRLIRSWYTHLSRRLAWRIHLRHLRRRENEDWVTPRSSRLRNAY